MNPERPENKPALRDVFSRALELQPGPEREAYLQDVRSKHPELHPKLVELLRNEKDDSFLEEPAAERAGALTLSPALAEGPGTLIGKYKLLEQLGEGGFGVVYMAEQKEPMKRRVALKIIKVGMDTREVVARFEAERQALAIMDHPNIAKVHDGGATETGRPYFVMELVRGVKITDYCDEKNLSTRERLDLFTQVCQAVQHAHQKGIIHRDLKPSNILVTVNDGVPVPKIIDFGIAKATQLELTEKTVFTRFHQFIGTPAYLSPEQADISSVDIDTRSDIYSLGVLLYELLTGKTPFDAKELLQAGLDEMRRTIREKEPARPSTRVGTLGADELTTTAKRRGVEPPKLASILSGDLDWMVMKCLEKDRGRRYETANGLAMDIQRYLNSEPVVACPPSAAYKFRKLVRRNKGVFTAAAIILVLLVAGVGVSSWEAIRARRSSRLAEAKEATAQQVSQFLQDMLQGAAPEVAKGRDATILIEILDQSADRITREMANQPEVEGELLQNIGYIYRELGQHEKAQQLLRRGVEIFRGLGDEYRGPLAATLGDLSAVLMEQGKLVQAESLIREDMLIKMKLFGTNDPFTAQCLANVAGLLDREGKLAEAESSYRQALEILKSRWGHESSDVAKCLVKLSDVLLEEGKLSDSEATSREGLVLMKRLHGDVHPDVAVALASLGNSLRDQGKLDESETALREALAVAEKVLSPDHPNVAACINNLAFLLDRKGKFHDAEVLHRQALAISRRTFGQEHPHVATSLNNLGLELQHEGKLGESEGLLRQSLGIRRKLFGAEHPDIANSLANIAGLLLEQDKLEEAASAAQEALAMYRKTVGNECPQVANCLSVLGRILDRQNKAEEAEPLLRQALAIRRKVLRPEDPDIGRSLANLASALRALGNADEAETTAREALASEQRILGSNNLDVAFCLSSLGQVLRDKGQLVEAESAMRDALALRRGLLPAYHPAIADSLKELADVLGREGKSEEAAQVASQELTIRRGQDKAGGAPQSTESSLQSDGNKPPESAQPAAAGKQPKSE